LQTKANCCEDASVDSQLVNIRSCESARGTGYHLLTARTNNQQWMQEICIIFFS